MKHRFRILGGAAALAAVALTSLLASAHGNVVPQAVDTTGLPVLGDKSAFPIEQVQFDRLPRGGWAIGMAVRKDKVELARRLQAALNDMVASGELKAVFAKNGVQVVKP